MENSVELLDKVHLQKYIYLMSLFVEQKIEALLFDELYIDVRRNDNYYMSGGFSNHEIERVLNTYFLDIDDFTPEELWEPGGQFQIDENELRKRTIAVLSTLRDFVDGK